MSFLGTQSICMGYLALYLFYLCLHLAYDDVFYEGQTSACEAQIMTSDKESTTYQLEKLPKHY